MFGKWFLATVLAMAMASAACGSIILDGSGNVTNWGLTPFSLPNQTNLHQGNTWSTIANNYAPINYPGEGRLPSGGEAYDLEELHLRITDHQVQFLVVTSAPWVNQSWGNNFYLGDMMLSINGQKFGIVTQAANQGLTQGALYRLDNPGDTVGIQPQAGSYWNYAPTVANDYGPDATVSNIVGPWAVSGGISPSELLGLAQVSSATFNYGGAENGTFLLEYTFDTSLLGLSQPGDITAQIAWGCGNDVIHTTGGPVPEPGTILMLAAGSVFMYVSSRRKRLQRRNA
ncbi:MAG: PEP-CTERM sorting domain-containing protein [Planctomycetota bacterium]|nr:PEP-CTERM sorting domain-containing protein [Planctomycetota bacterium]